MLFFGIAAISVYAEVITLKNGKTIEGKIVQASPDAISVEYYGSQVTYKLSEIEAIDGKKITYSTPESAAKTRQREYVVGLMKGQEYLKNGQYNEAVATFKKVLSLNPNHISAYSGIAAAYLSLKQFDDAVAYCDKGIAIDADFPNVYSIRGQAEFFLRRYDDAEKDLQKAIALLENPTKYPANDKLLDYLRNLLNAVRQQREYESLPQKQLSPPQQESAETKYFYHLDQAKNYIYRSQYLQAIKECEKALSINKQGDEAYNCLGQAYEGIGRYQQAQDAYRKAFTFNPDNAQAYYNMAILCSTHLRDNQSALEYLEKALEADPEYAEAHHNLAILFASLDDKQKAAAHYRMAIELFEKKGQRHYAQNVRRDFEKFSARLSDTSAPPDTKGWMRWFDSFEKIIFIVLLVMAILAIILIYHKPQRKFYQ